MSSPNIARSNNTPIGNFSPKSKTSTQKPEPPASPVASRQNGRHGGFPARPGRTAYGPLNRFTQRVASLLDRLREATAQIEPHYIPDPDATANAPGVACVAAGLVEVSMRRGSHAVSCPIHANEIDLSPVAKGRDASAVSRVYVAARSPQVPVAEAACADRASNPFAACEKMLVQGIESKQGVYQFVSTRAHKTPERSRENPLIGELLKKWDDGKNQTLYLGGRYSVTGIHEVPALNKSLNDHASYYMLNVEDTRDGSTITVPLTQAGVDFSGRLLREEQIIEADNILDVHNRNGILHSTPSTKQVEPLVASFSGVGRNATLITYREISKRIASGDIACEDQLDEALHEIILKGRAARGPRFIHSDEQYNELRNTLLKSLAAHLQCPPLPAPIDGPLNPTAEQVKQNQDSVKLALDLSGVRQLEEVPANARPFRYDEFEMRDNGGNGNCLYHALYSDGRENNPNLCDDKLNLRPEKLEEIRTRVAQVRINMKHNDTQEDLTIRKNNWAAAEMLLRQSSAAQLNAFDEYYKETGDAKRDRPKELTNRDFAVFQQKNGTQCDEREIQQWLALPENHHKTVIVIDAAAGAEAIVTLRHNEAAHFDKLINMKLSEAEKVRKHIADVIAPAIKQESDKNRTETPDTIVLYRSPGHFQRVIKQSTPDEIRQKRIAASADLAKNIQLSRAHPLNK